METFENVKFEALSSRRETAFEGNKFALPVRHIPIPGEHVYSIVIHPHQEYTSSPAMGMCLTRNTHPHRQWGCDSPEMHTFTVNAHSLYRVYMQMRSAAFIDKYTR